MYRNMMKVLGLMIVAGLLLSACVTAAPEPEKVVEKVVETVVETVEKEVIKEVEVPVEAEPVEKAVVEFGGFYPSDSAWGRMYRMLGYRFEAENPDCQFLYSEYPGVAGADALKLRAQEGDPVSMAGGGIGSETTAAEIKLHWESGMFYDLADVMAGPAYGQEGVPWLETFTEGAQTFMVTEGGRIGTIPYQQTQIVLWINQNIYSDLGLTVPTTWSELLANCEVLAKNNIACVGGGGFSGYIGYWYDMILFRLLGADKFLALYQNLDPEIRWDNTPEVLVAAEMLDDLIVKGYTSDGFVGGDFTAEQVAFFTDRSAHLFVGTWLVGEMADSIPEGFEMSVAYFPTVDGYEDVSPYEFAFGFLNGWTIYGAQDEHTLDCTVRYAKLLTSAEVMEEITSGDYLDFQTTIIGGQGPSGVPGIGDLLAVQKLWFPATGGIGAAAPEARSAYWENLETFASGLMTAEEFAQRMAEDWVEIFSRIEK